MDTMLLTTAQPTSVELGRWLLVAGLVFTLLAGPLWLLTLVKGLMPKIEPSIAERISGHEDRIGQLERTVVRKEDLQPLKKDLDAIEIELKLAGQVSAVTGEAVESLKAQMSNISTKLDRWMEVRQ